jgi:hypothetical protein
LYYGTVLSRTFNFFQVLYIIGFVKTLRLNWLGHVERMHSGRMPKMILKARMGEEEKGGDGGSNGWMMLNMICNSWELETGG